MKRLSALLVDDDGYTRNLLGSILKALECTVDHAVSSGEEAIRKCKKSRVDILFLDIEMPGMNGFETLVKILEDTPDQYVIMISAHSTLDNVRKAIELGAKGFIVKPYTTSKVRDLLENYRKDRSQPPTEPLLTAEDKTRAEEQSLPGDLELASKTGGTDDNPA